jgi:hypothetical protein
MLARSSVETLAHALMHEIGTRVGEPAPNIAALLGLTRLFARTHSLYDAP